jgi:hypothetical protein
MGEQTAQACAMAWFRQLTDNWTTQTIGECYISFLGGALSIRKKRLNRRIIASNLAEAIEQLERLRDLASTGRLNIAQLQVGLAHAYHHLNFAWNIRFASTSQYAALTDSQFKRWGRYPSGIENV